MFFALKILPGYHENCVSYISKRESQVFETKLENCILLFCFVLRKKPVATRSHKISKDQVVNKFGCVENDFCYEIIFFREVNHALDRHVEKDKKRGSY